MIDEGGGQVDGGETLPGHFRSCNQCGCGPGFGRHEHLHATDRLTSLYGGNADAAAQAIPARTLGDPGDFGRLCAMLCSDAAAFLTGAAIPVDGGAYAGLQ